MRIVVDTNILFTFFWPESFTKGLLTDNNFEFCSPEIALEEIERNSKEIVRKTKINSERFNNLFRELANHIAFIPLKDYVEFVRPAEDISDKDDLDFVALALKLNCKIWSNDPHLKEQTKINVLTTPEFIEYIEKTR